MDKEYFNLLEEKYDYDKETLSVLEKIIPVLLDYYSEYQDIILDAIATCEIIKCNSFQTVNNILRSKKFEINTDDFYNEQGMYTAYPKITKKNNKYYIDRVYRRIIIANEYNFLSIKGIAKLTHELCYLIKSYKKEFSIKDNYLIQRRGLIRLKYKLNNCNEVELITKNNYGLQKGLNCYDEDKIVSLIIKDNYISYNYELLKKVAMILDYKFSLKDIIRKSEFTGIKLENTFDKNIIKDLYFLTDKCYNLEEQKNKNLNNEEVRRVIDMNLKDQMQKRIYIILTKLMMSVKK